MCLLVLVVGLFLSVLGCSGLFEVSVPETANFVFLLYKIAYQCTPSIQSIVRINSMKLSLLIDEKEFIS